jgi:hypothetical protein
LPCPADPNIDTNLGDENCPSNPSGEILRGVIPGRALGLSGGRVLDAWDRQFTYVVVAEATQNNSFTSNAWPATLKLRDKAGGKLIQQGIAVIISHGANGGDAYLTTIGKGPEESPQGEDEKANLDNDHIFVQAPYSTNEKNPFDDQVLALTEDQIVQPLANQGALITKQAQALEKLKRIENALIAYMAGDWDAPDNCPPKDRKVRRRIPKSLKKLALLPQDLNDPWGNPIEYQPDPNAAKLKGCDAGLYTTGTYQNNVVFKLTSRGPDKTDPKDDILIKRRKGELLGTLVVAGIQVDYTNPSSPPPTP